MARVLLAASITLACATGCTSTPEVSSTAPPATSASGGITQASAPAVPLLTASATLPLAATPSTGASPLPVPRDVAALLRAEVASWAKVPYKENGSSRRGIGNAQFVRAVYRGVYDSALPDSYEGQIRSGRLAERDSLVPGDLLFFEGKGFGPFRSHSVGIVLDREQFAIATKDDGVVVEQLSQTRWREQYKTARRVSPDRAKEAPAFDVAQYGSTEALLKDVAEAWRGTLYKQGGTSFEGIGNDEFIRNIYEAIYDTELEGAPKQWATMGSGIKRTDLKAGDIILYEAVGIGSLVNQRHAGMFIGDGTFVHSMKGGAVTISKLNDERWRKAYVTARRIDPDALERAAERRTVRSSPPPIAASATPADMTEYERALRDATEPWKGTPYKLGGTSKSGVDCSALVRALYDDVYGVTLPRTAEEQERLGAKIERRNLMPGDLVFFRTQGMGPFFKSRHVGIYLGNGEFAQASGRLGVNVARLDQHYWNKKYVSARRLPKG